MRYNMNKKIFIIFIFIILLVTFISFFSIYDWYIDNNKYIATSKRNSHIIYTADENILNKYYVKNKNTIVVFLASWCPQCLEEAPELNEFMLSNPDIPVIVVSLVIERECNHNCDGNIKDGIDKHSVYVAQYTVSFFFLCTS